MHLNGWPWAREMSSSLRSLRRKKKRIMDQRDEASTDTPVSVDSVREPKSAPACLKIDPNGATVFIEYYPDKQCVQVDYDRTKFKTWDMIIGILHMALIQAETRREMTIAQNIQKQQFEMAAKQQQEMETQMMAQHLANEGSKKILVGR